MKQRGKNKRIVDRHRKKSTDISAFEIYLKKMCENNHEIDT